jgi:hypothetical protein
MDAKPRNDHPSPFAAVTFGRGIDAQKANVAARNPLQEDQEPRTAEK